MFVEHADLVNRCAKSRDFTSCLQAAFAGMESVLEPGCGFGWNLAALATSPEPPLYLIGVEVNDKKIKDKRADRSKVAGVIIWKADALEYMSALEDKSFDGVVLVDFVEHFDPEKGKWILAQAKRIVRKRVMLWGPMGNHPQDYDEWGTGGDQWETHRWTMWPKDLEEAGYTAVPWENYHGAVNAKKQPRDRGAMFGIYTR